ncbi:class I SAM-dependent methyltransferase [bacterium]|nr:MAG: class I SAM-dependent methyltransferase [bacterium]
MINNNQLANIEATVEKKLRGGYYTPPQIAQYITDWAITKDTETILEPSCGDGIFINSIVNTFHSINKKGDIYKKIHAVELYINEARKIDTNIIDNINLYIGDFFKYCKDHLTDKVQFDCIVGNPPFIRYQDFPEDQRIPAFALMKRAGLNPNRLTNTWIPFLVSATLLLKENGRIGMVIPAELFQVNYAAETRRFLSESYSKLQILTFRKLVFKKIQQEIIILLGEKKPSQKHYINIFELNDIDDLKTFSIPIKNHKKELDHSSEKWTQYYLSKYEISLLRNLKNNPYLPVSGEYINVDVGIVTGQNKYFVLSPKEVEFYKLKDYVIKIVGKANHLKGIVINQSDLDNLILKQKQIFLLKAPDLEYNELPLDLKKYIDFGISQDYHLGYKCRIRKKWWVVPSVWIPDAFMLRQVHSYPKLILNNCDAVNTDTLHRVKFINGAKGHEIASAFVNSLTFAFSEVMGRSYGGGVLTFEPSEAEKLPLPIMGANKLDFNEINFLIRHNNITEALEITDNKLLKDGLNLSQSDIDSLNVIWQKLRNRRIYRNKR